ncbi:MAG TPA: transcriptional regulator [Dehalococcoidia bacterium]|nr:transcriptional regulator [Dehalococcoidia bacterium]
MTGTDLMVTELMSEARQASEAGEWQRAYALLCRADSINPLAGEQLTFLADVAYAAGHPDVTITAWERAYGLASRGGDRLAAAEAAARVALHILIDSGLMAPVRAWLARAEGLLGDEPQSEVHAWLAIVRTYERFLSGDVEGAHDAALSAIELGSAFQPVAVAVGNVAAARCLILRGEVEEGLSRLEEAGALLLTGDLPALPAGMVYCELVCGLQGLAQYDLAEQWTEAMERWHPGKPVGSVHGRCRVHRAELLRLRGDYERAEAEAEAACNELRPFVLREMALPLRELGRIRLRRGDLDSAEEALLRVQSLGWEAQPDLARVFLARDQVQLALASISAALDEPILVPSKELPPHSDLRRAPLLEAAVEIEIAAGELEDAREHSRELTAIAERFKSKALRAGAAQARGLVCLAAREPAGAVSEFRTALELWTEVGAPYETAVAHAGLAAAYDAAGNAEMGLLEWRAGAAIFERIGASLEVQRLQRAIEARSRPAKGEAVAQTIVKPADTANAYSFRREGDFWTCVFAGRVIRLHDTKGIHYLVRLLASPGREFHVLDLVSLEAGHAPRARLPFGEDELAAESLDLGQVLDVEARSAYRRRLAEIEADIAEAEAAGDHERLLQASEERSFLARELARAVGLGGRGRRAGAIAERARASVTKAIRQTIARIQPYDRDLAEHLQRTVRTGAYCAYLPDPRLPVQWQV